MPRHSCAGDAEAGGRRKRGAIAVLPASLACLSLVDAGAAVPLDAVASGRPAGGQAVVGVLSGADAGSRNRFVLAGCSCSDELGVCDWCVSGWLNRSFAGRSVLGVLMVLTFFTSCACSRQMVLKPDWQHGHGFRGAKCAPPRGVNGTRDPKGRCSGWVIRPVRSRLPRLGFPLGPGSGRVGGEAARP
jgi:hypothetical protein